jgi:hypothetical protein
VECGVELSEVKFGRIEGWMLGNGKRGKGSLEQLIWRSLAENWKGSN